jgi:hypothetical protein
MDYESWFLIRVKKKGHIVAKLGAAVKLIFQAVSRQAFAVSVIIR